MRFLHRPGDAFCICYFGCYYALSVYFRVGRRLTDVQSCGRRRGGHADAEMAAEASAWCVPAGAGAWGEAARTAARRGRGAAAPWVCSQVEAIMASIVSNVEGWPRSRARSPGECQPARTCGETSIRF